MKTSRLIRNFIGNDLIEVSVEMLKDALDLYEASLDIIVKNPPRDENDKIPGMKEFNLCHDIIQVYYEQNPGFNYRNIREGFTSEQLNTLQNIQGDREIQDAQEKRRKLKGYGY